MARGRIALLLGAILGMALIVSSCGSGSDDDTAATASLTKAQFIKKADAICLAANGKRLANMAPYIREAKEGNPLPPQAKQEELVISLVLPPFQEEAEEIAELPVPEGDEERVEQIVEAIEGAVERGEDDPKSILEGASSQFSEAEKLGAAYGFKQCGRS